MSELHEYLDIKKSCPADGFDHNYNRAAISRECLGMLGHISNDFLR